MWCVNHLFYSFVQRRFDPVRKSALEEAMLLRAVKLKPETYRVQPWKNGLGTTTEIAVDDRAPFRWRLSRAKLAGSSQFSEYPGYDRLLMLLSGGPVRLVHESNRRERTLSTFLPHNFSGEGATRAEASSPADDFNVFVLKEAGRASLFSMPAEMNEEIQFPLNGIEHFLHVYEGAIRVEDRNDQQTWELATNETLRVSRDTSKELLALRVFGTAPGTRVVWVVVHYAEPKASGSRRKSR